MTKAASHYKLRNSLKETHKWKKARVFRLVSDRVTTVLDYNTSFSFESSSFYNDHV